MSFLRKQESRLLCVMPLGVIPAKAGIQDASPLVERPAEAKPKPGEGAPVSFLRKQESRKETTGFPLSWE